MQAYGDIVPLNVSDIPSPLAHIFTAMPNSRARISIFEQVAKRLVLKTPKRRFTHISISNPCLVSIRTTGTLAYSQYTVQKPPFYLRVETSLENNILTSKSRRSSLCKVVRYNLKAASLVTIEDTSKETLMSISLETVPNPLAELP